MNDRELIDAAVAAGKVRRIPMGVTVNHSEWAKVAVPKNIRTVPALSAVLLALQTSGHPMKLSAISVSVRDKRYPAGTIPFLDGGALARFLGLLEARGMVRRVPGGPRRVDLWEATEKAPVIDAAKLRAKLRARAAMFPLQPQDHPQRGGVWTE